MYKMTNNDLQKTLHRKLEIEQHDSTNNMGELEYWTTRIHKWHGWTRVLNNTNPLITWENSSTELHESTNNMGELSSTEQHKSTNNMGELKYWTTRIH